jgi:hypothetical protein
MEEIRKNMRSRVRRRVERWIIYLSVIEVMGNQSNYQAIHSKVRPRYLHSVFTGRIKVSRLHRFSVQNLEIPDNGLIVHLKKFGKVKVFRRIFKNEIPRYYIMYVPDQDALFLISLAEFKELHSIHWGIECYHRAIKQVCGIELFMRKCPRGFSPVAHFAVRTSEAIKTHFFSAIRSFTQLELMRTQELIENWYELQRNLSLQVARDFILQHLEQKVGLNSHNQITVNA